MQCPLRRPTALAPKKQADKTDRAKRPPGLQQLDWIGIYGRRGIAEMEGRALS
ncbi:hypothetical protein EN974_27870 [Mesorhizobium sp. M7A.F.Ca.CA.001.12.2.1]|nr:hypothetical protein EN974_27870 [Mesorhizobium sp. M7A.F.Ca.CA.001.12.2.1]RUZ23928.1 hypothetical protein EN949_16810 [Mesorhizobium sp. M7A.F.Ca.US.007.01.2.1]RUZ49511.1 hypothetical protein EN948_04540 [Mesorhizobium sp. M7A.F.Ca.US.003.02.1.1]RUZ54567.1 hypothetical protein EN950_29135 [Mesorhizobium sp. M7A.F.Ca.US.007.01.1.1]RUZ58852.1 hypothetical protein EN947_36235 [Mesorhizobium sp. M7A.F.Ca.US.003.02.2.1]